MERLTSCQSLLFPIRILFFVLSSDMKLLYCIDSLSQPGGTERVLTTKLNWLCKQNDVQVRVVTLYEKEVPFFELADKVVRIMLPVSAKDYSEYRHELGKVLHEYNPDVTIHVAGMSDAVLPDMTDGSAKVMEFHYTKNFLVNFVRGLHSIRFRSLHLLKMQWLQWKLARMARRYDKFVGLTRRDVNLWGNPPNMTYIYNPLSFKSAKKSQCRDKRIIAVGSFTPAKGMDQLIHAFARVAHKNREWKLDIYGSGQDDGFLQSLVTRYCLESQVMLHAPNRNIGEQLVRSSIYAFPSRSDGFGLVITEAMECGLPTVAFDCECGPGEIVTPETGILVPDKDIAAFANALDRLMNDELLRISMGRNAQERAKFFWPESIMPQWMELFKSLKRQ